MKYGIKLIQKPRDEFRIQADNNGLAPRDENKSNGCYLPSVTKGLITAEYNAKYNWKFP
jgi:hypothetical protein